MDIITSGLFGGQSGAWRMSGPGFELSLEGGADAKDDCAWYDFSGKATLVFGSDYVRGPKFMLYELGYLSNYDIGYYLAGANISDIAAMGAAPIGLTTVVRYPADLDDTAFLEVMAGIRDCCERAGCLNVGGDVGTAERIILSASAIGVAEQGRVLTRSGAAPRDHLVLSQPTGIAAAAMLYFSSADSLPIRLSDEDEEHLLKIWRRVQPEVELGVALSRQGLATACQDTSDGLRATIEQLARSSGIGFEVFQDRVPIDPVVQRVADLMNVDALELTFGGSVDFRLLFTVPEAKVAHLPESVHVIGRASEGEVVFIDAHGTAQPLPGTPWAHQADPLGQFRASRPTGN